VRQRCQAAPGRAGQRRADRVDQAAVRVAGDELDSGQAASDEVAEEAQPAGAVLGAGDLQAEDLAVPLGVHPDREQGVHVHDAPALADLEHQGVGGHEGVRAGVQRPGAERLDLGVERLGHVRHL
jgi:collagen type II alpha